ncbi:MAG TPA: DUF6603 domain-containing protein [Methylomirabilota bacterium]|nr:DUF6603 domain-containing protein [Methylomirabilota bacterium]
MDDDDQTSTVEQAAAEIGAALEPLRGVFASQEAMLQFIRDELGIDAPDTLHALGIDLGTVDAAIKALDDLGDALAAEDPDQATVALRAAQLAAAVAVTVTGLMVVGTRAASGQDPAFVTASGIAEQLPRRLLDWLVVQHIEDTSLVALEALRVLGIVEVEPVEADPATFTTQHVHRAIKLDRLVALLTDPRHWLELAYGWGTDHPTLERLLERLFQLAVTLGIPARLNWSDLQRAAVLAGPGAFDPDQADAPPELRLPVLSAETTGSQVEAGVGLVVLPAHDSQPQALALLPFADGALEAEITLDQLATWTLAVSGTLDLQAGVGVVARPGAGLRVVTDIDGEGAQASGTLEVRLARATTADPVALVSFASSSGLFVTGVEVRTAALLDAAKPAELVVEAGVKQAVLRVKMGEADGFLRSMVPDLDLTFDAGLGVSSLHGTYFVGGAALEITRAVDRRIGPVQIRQLGVAVRPPATGEPPGLKVDVGLAVALSIGPVTGVVSGIGARLTITERPGGNLGPVDLAVGFKPPDGIGLELDGGPISGGGFLFFDAARAQYAGAMELHAAGIAVKAIGLLTTRLPGGAPGFSLLVIISAEFTPVQLGLGFRLEGVGGLVGINRTVAVEALRSGLKTGALSAVLSPRDPVGNAAQLVATLSGLFPPAAGRYVFGPLARIGWGTPTLITIDLCLVLEVPAPVRLVLLGRLRAVLPDERAAIVRLQMDMLGVIDFDREEASVDATLVDSRLAEFALTGDMALRMSWGAQATFLLAVGGFHPRFTAPPGFPALARVAVALADGDNPRLRLEAYLAVTSNTVQLGARLDLSVRAGSFTVAGFLAFDALVTLQPFAFTVDIAGKLAVSVSGHTILSVSLALTLSGPQPWHARGKASFSILFFDVSVHFDVTIGAAPPPALATSVDVGSLVRAAFADVRAWDAQLPAGGAALVTLRAIDTADVLAHPLGTLQVRQRVAPLERTLERFGANVPSGARFFKVSSATIGGDGVALAPLTDLFAPGQFRALTDEQKLSLPSFETMPAGVTIGTPDVAHGTPVSVGVVYEQRIVPAPGVTLPAPGQGDMPDDVFFALTEPVAARPAPTFALHGVS